MDSSGTNHILYFSKNERRAIIFIVLLMMVIYSIPYIIYYFFYKTTIVSYGNIVLKEETPEETKKDSLFFFDPNLITTHQWQLLGIGDKTSASIKKYISKGGKFKRAEDIYKIWGIGRERADSLLPYIKISNVEEIKVNRHFSVPPKKTLIDINMADSADFEKLPFIGPKLSSRILNFREALGGFYKIEQVGETFGISDSVFQIIKPMLFISKAVLRKININSATVETMKTHPYIRYKIANAIVSYRNQHGNFSSLDDIRNIVSIDENTLQKVIPYLEL